MQPSPTARATERPLAIPIFTRIVPADLLRKEETQPQDSALSNRQRPSPSKALSRQDADKETWMTHYRHFARLWAARVDNTIRKTHPLFQWVTKQRWLARNNNLRPWKKALLDQIGFPYQTTTTPLETSDRGYAQELIRFYRERGHYAPTAATGGAGLTKWVAAMRDSEGKAGHPAQSDQQSAELATQTLKQEIPDFDWEKTHKASADKALGQVATDQPTSVQTAMVSAPGPERTIVSRAVHARTYQLRMGRDIRTSHNELVDLCAMATYFEQAVRASIRMGSHDDIWWLKSILGSEITIGKGVRPKDAQTRKLHLKDLQPKPTAPMDGTIGYQLRVQEESGQTMEMTLDYDWCLADRTHRFAHPRDYNDPHLSLAAKTTRIVNWESWLQTSKRPTDRLPSPNSTANAAFFKGHDKLLAAIREFTDANGSDATLNITWGRHYEVYKFIEHVVLRIKQGNFPPHHAIWLARLNFTWGQEWKSIQTLLQKHDGQHETRR